MKLLLTSNGLSNESIAKALEELVGKPRKDIRIAFIPTAAFPEDDVDDEPRDWLVDDMYRIKEFCGFIDILSLADVSQQNLIARLEYVDVIFVGGGNAFYLSYWMEKSGLFDALPRLLETRVYAGISAGSMIASASLRSTSYAINNTETFNNKDFDAFAPKGKSAGKTAQLANICFRPHLNKWKFGNNTDYLEKIVADMQLPVYAIDDESALKIVDDAVEVISEGTWRLLEP